MNKTGELKIAVSGSPGTGKTTLVKALAERLDLAIIEEDLAPLASADQALRQIAAAPHAARHEVLAAKKRLVEGFIAWTRQRTALYSRHGRFVADRWEADVVDWWLVRFGMGNHHVDGTTMALLRDLQKKSTKLDFVVAMPPLTSPFSTSANEDGTPRNNGFTSRALHDLLTGGLVRQLTRLPLVTLPEQRLSVAERVDFVIAAIDSTRRKAVDGCLAPPAESR